MLTILVLNMLTLAFNIQPAYSTSLVFRIARIYVNPPYFKANLNDAVSLNVVIESVANMYGYQFYLYWNKSILTCTQWNYTTETWIQNPSTAPSQWGSNFLVAKQEITDMPDGRSRYWLVVSATNPAPSVSGTFSVVTLNFKVIGVGQSLLDLDKTKIGDPDAQPISHDAADGILRVGISAAIYIKSDGSIDPPSAPIQRSGNLYTLENNILINYPLDGIIIEKDNIVVDGAGYTLQASGNGTGITLQERNSVTIKNLKITSFRFGIWLYRSSNNNFSRNIITNNGYGVYFWNSSTYNRLDGSNITTNTYYGLVFGRSSDYNSIIGNRITNNNEYGILIYDASNYNSLVGNKIINNNNEGVGLYYSSKNSFSGNNVTNNGYGILLGQSSRNNIIRSNISTNTYYGLVLSYSTNNSIVENIITANIEGGAGILLSSSSSTNSISRNNVTSNYDGIKLIASSNNNVIGNNIMKNNWDGIFLSKSLNNLIYHNNIVNNSHQVYTEFSFNVWDDGYPSGGNYWSDYKGVDANSDGIGDTPYIIDTQNKDNYPLTRPWTPHNIAVIEVVTSKTIVGQGFTISINTTIVNRGDFTENFQVKVYANINITATSSNIILTSTDFTTITFLWNTTGFGKGKYTIKAVATTVPGETDTTDNTFVDGIVQVTKKADVNGDNEVNVLDLIVVATALGTHPGEPNWKPNADVRNDGEINVLDLILIANYLGT